MFIKLTPDTETQVIDGICKANRYQETINKVPNPESQSQFAERMTYAWFKLQIKIGMTLNAAISIDTSIDKTFNNIF